MIAKPVQAPKAEIAAEPAQTPPVTVVPPHKADAKPVPRAAISPDIRKKIEESLASKPNVISDPRQTVLIKAETSQGMKTVRATGDVDAAVDGAAETTRKSDRPKKDSDKLLVTSRPKQQPAYLKSVTQVVVPSTDPEAPYGRDENNRPILPGRSDQELATDLLSKSFLKAGACPHKSNPNYCLLCGTANYKAAPAEPVDLEDQLRSLFGITTASGPTGRVQSKKFDYFPEILGITRGQLIGLLELTVGIEPRAIKKKVLKSRAAIETKIAELLRIPKHIEKRKQLIAKSEECIRSWSAHIMKIQVKRGERNPEDILDKVTREQFKREEFARIARCKQKIAELRKRVSGLDELQQRLAAWGSNPDDYEMITTTEDVAVKFGEKFKFSHEDEDSGPKQNIDGYLALLEEYDLLKDVFRRLHQFPTLDAWRYFENEIVLQAIGFGLYRPTKRSFTDYPQLKRYLNGAPVGDESEQDDPENKLILKTGGAQIGGSIYSAGHRNGRQRGLESFDKRKPSRRPGEVEYGGERPDNFYGDVDSGDLSERSGDE